MWVLTLSDLSAEKRTFDGTLAECALTARLFNQTHEDKYHSGCFVEVKQYDFVPRK